MDTWGADEERVMGRRSDTHARRTPRDLAALR